MVQIADTLSGKISASKTGLAVKARKILRAAARAKQTGVMASGNPTVNLGAAAATSSIRTGYGNSGAASAGGQSHPGNTALMTDLGPKWVASLQGSGGYMPLHVFSNFGFVNNNIGLARMAPDAAFCSTGKYSTCASIA